MKAEEAIASTAGWILVALGGVLAVLPQVFSETTLRVSVAIISGANGAIALAERSRKRKREAAEDLREERRDLEERLAAAFQSNNWRVSVRALLARTNAAHAVRAVLSASAIEAEDCKRLFPEDFAKL